MVDLSGAISMLASSQYAGLRRTRPSPAYVGGRAQPFDETPLLVVGSVQPATGLMIQRLPEGKRNGEVMVIFTSTELRSAQAENAPDLLYVDDSTFEVGSVQRWDKLGNFYQCVLTRID